MKYLSERYASVFNHRGMDICTLKIAVPAAGDEMGYRIDDKAFEGIVFNDIADAIMAINKLIPGSSTGKTKKVVFSSICAIQKVEKT